jgi:hypothetical protein
LALLKPIDTSDHHGIDPELPPDLCGDPDGILSEDVGIHILDNGLHLSERDHFTPAQAIEMSMKDGRQLRSRPCRKLPGPEEEIPPEPLDYPLPLHFRLEEQKGEDRHLLARYNPLSPLLGMTQNGKKENDEPEDGPHDFNPALLLLTFHRHSPINEVIVFL